jgi:hypothetical protein
MALAAQGGRGPQLPSQNTDEIGRLYVGHHLSSTLFRVLLSSVP